MHRMLPVGLGLLVAVACTETRVADVPTEAAHAPVRDAAGAPPAAGQRGEGKSYEIAGSEVWDVGDPQSGRRYQVFVALPRSYAEHPQRRYPVLYVTDADYGFPILRQISRRLNVDGPVLQDFILVGLSYAVGEEGMVSRRRDYTPTPAGAHNAPADAVHGGGADYMRYLRNSVFPFVEGKYRVDAGQRLFLGHSYGGLLGAQILFTAPDMFSGYILGSASLWYDDNVMEKLEQNYARTHEDLPASVYMYVGQYEDMKPGDPRYAKRYNMVSDARRLERALASRGYPSLRIKLETLDDEDHLSVAPRGFTHGLKYLLGTQPVQ